MADGADRIHVALAADANYRPGLETTRETIIRSCSRPERLEFHVFDESALAKLPEVEGLGDWNGSRMPNLRLWLAELLPTVDRIVYADVDTLWFRDIVELWDRPQTEPIAWVRDLRVTRERALSGWLGTVTGGGFDPSRYCCSGVCVMNLKWMRETDFVSEVRRLLSAPGRPEYPDQDVLNAIFNSRSEILPPEWDALGDCENLPRDWRHAVYHVTGAGRHFHAAKPPVYPPQHEFWWHVAHGTRDYSFRARLFARLWPLHWLARLLPMDIRFRLVRQLFFARLAIKGEKGE